VYQETIKDVLRLTRISKQLDIAELDAPTRRRAPHTAMLDFICENVRIRCANRLQDTKPEERRRTRDVAVYPGSTKRMRNLKSSSCNHQNLDMMLNIDVQSLLVGEIYGNESSDCSSLCLDRDPRSSRRPHEIQEVSRQTISLFPIVKDNRGGLCSPRIQMHGYL
jgi:hypothetical protein